MRSKKIISMMFVGFMALAASGAAQAKIKVVTTLPDLAWVAQQIGKDNVEAQSLLKGTENPHFADAVPDYIRSAADADVVCAVGLDLEVGWLPKVLARSGNAKVQSGGAGFCEMGKAIEPLDKPTGAVDRSMGDVHPFGNPHFWLSPKALAKSTSAMVDAFVRVDPSHEQEYRKAAQEFSQRMDKLVEQNRAKLAPLVAKASGPSLIEYHKEFAYLLDAYGLKSMGSIEEKPGVPPSAGRIAEVAQSAKKAGVKFALAATYNPKNVLARFRELSGVPVLEVQTMIQPKGKIKDYSELQSSIIDEMVKLLKAGGKS